MFQSAVIQERTGLPLLVNLNSYYGPTCKRNMTVIHESTFHKGVNHD